MPSVPPWDLGEITQLWSGGRQPPPQVQMGKQRIRTPAHRLLRREEAGSQQHYGAMSRPNQKLCLGSRGAGTRALPGGRGGGWPGEVE